MPPDQSGASHLILSFYLADALRADERHAVRLSSGYCNRFSRVPETGQSHRAGDRRQPRRACLVRAVGAGVIFGGVSGRVGRL